VCIVMCKNALGWVLGRWYCHITDMASGVEAALRLTCAHKLLSASRGGGECLTDSLYADSFAAGQGYRYWVRMPARAHARTPKHARTPAGVHMRALAGCAAAANAASAAGDVPLLFLHGVGLGLARSARAALRVPCAAGATVSAPQAAPSRPSGQSAARRMGKPSASPPPDCTSAQESLHGRRGVVHHAG